MQVLANNMAAALRLFIGFFRQVIPLYVITLWLESILTTMSRLSSKLPPNGNEALGHDTRCIFSCTFNAWEMLISTNVWYVKNTCTNCHDNVYISILHLSRLELRCKLQQKLCDMAFTIIMAFSTRRMRFLVAHPG